MAQTTDEGKKNVESIVSICLYVKWTVGLPYLESWALKLFIMKG